MSLVGVCVFVCVCRWESIRGQEERCFFNQGGQARTLAPSSWKTDEIFGCRIFMNPKCIGRKNNQVLDSI